MLLGFCLQLSGYIKALWIPAWELTTPENIDQLVADARDNHIDRLLVEIRYRGDALYIPNRIDSTFYNPEKRCYLLNNQPQDFDPLAYLLKKVEKEKIEVHAWITVFVVTVHDTTKMTPDHLYYTHPEWITSDFMRNPMQHNDYEGAYLDPGIPQVHLYLLNVVMDIVKNYPVAGIHLDYIRYPDSQYGYNDIARQFYSYDVTYQDSENWLNWKEEQVSSFVRKVRISLNNAAPGVELSAAVFPSLREARTKYSQNWLMWLENDLLDHVFIMAYTIHNGDFEILMQQVAGLGHKSRVIAGLRAWHYGAGYPAEKINDKIQIARKLGFAGISLFSYTGIKENNYFKYLKMK